MNNKIMKRGKTVGGLVRYLFGRGHANEHRDQRVIAAADTLGIDDGTRLDRPECWPQVLDLARDMDANRRLAAVAPEGGWVWHCAISLPPGERLGDAQWAEVARTAVERLGFTADESTGRAGCRWIAVHHGPSGKGNDHIHLAVNLVREDGRVAAPGRDRMAMSRVCGELERRFGLHVVEGRAGRGMPGYTRAAKERAHRAARRARQQDRPAARPVPETQTLARKVRAAATLARTEAEFVVALADAGVLARPRYARGGRTHVVGYSVALADGAGRGAGGPIWYGGGKLAADLSLPRLRARWTAAGGTGTPPDALAAWQRIAGDVADGAAPTTVPAAVASAAAAVAEPAARDQGEAGAWWQAADRVQDAARELEDLPDGATAAWTAAASDAAALLSLLADHVAPALPLELRDDLAAAAHTLAWSAQQTPRRPHPHHQLADPPGSRGPARGELGDVARIVRAATRRGEGAAAVVAIAVLALAVLALVAVISAWHQRHRHHRQAAALDHGARRCQLGARTSVAATAPPWHRRPHGALDQLQLDHALQAAAADAAAKADLEYRAAALAVQARAGRGPAATRLGDHAAALAAAATAEARLPAARADLDQAAAQHTRSRARVAELTALAERGRVALGLKGTTPGRVAGELAIARDELAAAAAAAGDARTRVDELVRQAAAPFPRATWRPGAAATAHADLTARWDALLAAAIDDDVRTAPRRARGLGDDVLADALTARRLLADSTPHLARPPLAELRTEQAIRAALPAHRAAQEDHQRAHAQHQARPAAMPGPDTPHRHRPHRPGPGRGGPSR